MSSISAITETIPTVFTTLRYRDARQAIQWLHDAFGPFTRQRVPRSITP